MKIFICIVAIATAAVYCNAQTFNKQFVGVAYSPYVKNWEGTSTPYWNTYTLDDIKQMLTILGTKFSSLSTYSMGVSQWNVGSPWDQADSNCLIPRAAAQLNKDSNSLRFTVNQGVHQLDDGTQQAKEIANAFSAAQEANSIYPGTITGITFTNEYVTDVGRGTTVLNMIRNNKNRGFKVGTRIHTCGEIYNTGSGLYNVLVDILKESDFIYCNLYPDSSIVNSGIPTAVQAVADAYFGYRQKFHEINPNIEVSIGETGWPSQGKSFNNSPNTVQNLKDFWTQMGQWASNNQVKVQFFEAFDEPWKSDVNNGDPNASNGKYGAEGHYGWWYLSSNNKPYVYIDKVTGARMS